MECVLKTTKNWDLHCGCWLQNHSGQKLSVFDIDFFKLRTLWVNYTNGYFAWWLHSFGFLLQFHQIWLPSAHFTNVVSNTNICPLLKQFCLHKYILSIWCFNLIAQKSTFKYWMKEIVFDQIFSFYFPASLLAIKKNEFLRENRLLTIWWNSFLQKEMDHATFSVLSLLHLCFQNKHRNKNAYNVLEGKISDTINYSWERLT